MYICLCLCILCLCSYPEKPEKAVRCLGAGYIGSCECLLCVLENCLGSSERVASTLNHRTITAAILLNFLLVYLILIWINTLPIESSFFLTPVLSTPLPSLSLSAHLSVCPTVCLSVNRSFSLSLTVCVCMCAHARACMCSIRENSPVTLSYLIWTWEKFGKLPTKQYVYHI